MVIGLREASPLSSPRKRGPSKHYRQFLLTVPHIRVRVYWVPGRHSASKTRVNALMARPGRQQENSSHRIPREHIAGALERRQRRPERALELLIESLWRPAFG